MSIYGEEIIERLPLHSVLRDPNHPMSKLIDYTIGEWLQRQDDSDWFNQFFLTDATGKYLDIHGGIFNVPRKLNESDEKYRQRIIYESLGHLTSNFLINVYNVNLYAFVDDFDATENTLTSDNPYINGGGYLADATEEVKSILNKKFVLGAGVTWL